MVSHNQRIAFLLVLIAIVAVVGELTITSAQNRTGGGSAGVVVAVLVIIIMRRNKQ